MKLLLFSLIASVMVVVIVAILYLSEKVKNYAGLFLVYFLLGMMISMFASAVYYLYNPSSLSLALAFLTNSIYMVLFLVPFFLNAKKLSLRVYSGGHELFISILAVINEFLMGYTFNLAYLGKSYFNNALNVFQYSVNSYWFFYPMMAEMLSIYIINYLKFNVARKDLFPLIGITTFPPILLNDTYWVYSTMVISLGLCVIGLTSKDKVLKTVYLTLLFAIVSVILTPLLYEAVILIGMVSYYVRELKNHTNAFIA